jgi:hypothetical protein
MSIKSRIDQLSRALGSGRLWDGSSAESLANCGYLDDRADLESQYETPSKGTERLALYMQARGVLCDVLEGRRPGADQEAIESAREALDIIDLAPDADLPAIVSRLMELGRWAGFAPAEMDRHRDSLAALVNRPDPWQGR